jgi:hypothetical protein
MTNLFRFLWFPFAALFTAGALAQAPSEPQRSFTQAELDQVLAPIALYPDALLSQILMAATYPEDVYEAAGESRRSGLRGEDAVRAVEKAPWDPSVISLAAFPEVLSMMDERRDWTERLGDAYIAQPEQVMDTVQALRRRADAAGSLRSSDEIVVQRMGDDYLIEPPSPDIVYVPYYDSRVVYGDWWWPDYQPVYWNPWPGYAYRPGYRGFGWGYGISLRSGFFFGGIDWRHRHIRYSSHRPWYFHGHNYRGGNRWSHDRNHRYVQRDQRWRGGDRDGRRGGDGRWEGRDRDGQRGARPDGQRDGREGRGGRDSGNRGDRERGDRGGGDRSGRERRSELAPGTQAVTASPATPRYRGAEGFFRETPRAAPQPASAPQVERAARSREAPGGREVFQARQRAARDPSTNEAIRRPEARAFNAPRAASVPGAQPRVARPERAANPVQRAERAAVPAPAAQQRAATPVPRASQRAESAASRPSGDNHGRGGGGGRGRDR